MPRPYRRKNQDPVEYWLSSAEKAREGCLEVRACRDEDGYPLVWVGGRRPDGKLKHLSRLVLEKKLGRPLVAFALHTCDNSACVNPDHLYEGTQLENRADAVRRGRTARGAANGKPRQLSEKAILDIRASRGLVLQKDLAKKYGVHQVTVSQIQRRRSWAWM